MRFLRNRNTILWGIGILLVVSWVIVSNIRAVKANEPMIQTARVERGTVVSSVSASGVLRPLTTVDVKSNAGGRVEVLAVDVGTVVKAGQLIAKIDPTDSQTALNQAEADLSAANARLSQSQESLLLQKEQSKSQIQQAEEAYQAARARLAQAETEAKVQPILTKSTIQQAEANHRAAVHALEQLKVAGMPQGMAQAKAAYDQAKAAFDKAKLNLDRQRRLYEKGFISANQFESTQLEYETAKAQFDSASERMKTVKDEYDTQLKAAEAHVEQTKAALDSATANAVQADIKRQEVMAARAALRQAEAALAAAKSSARQVPIKAAEIRTARAEIVRSEAQVENARTQLDIRL